MLKKMLIIVCLLIACAVIYLALMSYQSRNDELPGLSQGKLQPCPQTPNCITSEYPSAQSHFMSPIDLEAQDADEMFTRIGNIIIELDGIIVERNQDYIGATFTSSIFRFIDDVEFRLDHEAKVIHLRSASRTGRSDLGANRKRIDSIKQRMQR